MSLVSSVRQFSGSWSLWSVFAAGLLLAFSQSLPAQSDWDRLLAQAAVCTSGQSVDPFRQLEGMVRQSVDAPAMRREVEEAALIRLLAPSATFEARRFACQQLGIIGSNASLSALGELLEQEQTAGIACLALASYPPGKADEVLRRACVKVSGKARLQIINALGDRRDAKAVGLLSTAATGNDPAVAEAAIASLGKIGDAAARKALSALARRAGRGLGCRAH